jgi:ariadne-1
MDSEVTSAQRAKAELDRYLHYYQRFHGHHQSLKYASAQREEAEKKMMSQQENQRAMWTDVEYLKDAVEQTIRCRRVLKYTYVLGYFLVDGTAEQTLFEHHQEMLEKNTERLQEQTELPVAKLDRATIVNLARVTEKFMSSLLESLSGGVVHIDRGGTPSASLSSKIVAAVKAL